MNPRIYYKIIFVLSIFAIIFSIALPCFADYQIIDLGTLGGDNSVAYSVNNAGQVVGLAGISTSSSVHHAFLWNNGIMNDLGTLGGSYSEAYGINEAGQVVGKSRISCNVGCYWHAFLYNGSAMTDLGTLGGNDSEAYGINNDGKVVGTAFNSNNTSHAFLYSNGIMSDLGYGYALNINDATQVVGGIYTPNGDSHAFLYNNGAITDLGTLGGAGSAAYSINNSTQIVGGSSTSTSGGHAFLWSNGIMTDVHPSDNDSIAYGINNSGNVVGKLYSNGSWHASLWSNGVMTNLNDFLPYNSGWTLVEARDINDSGIIVGTGDYNGQTRAFLMITPEPLSSILFIAGGGVLGLAGLRRKHRNNINNEE